jgi:aspartate aminotransferase-like enzyme
MMALLSVFQALAGKMVRINVMTPTSVEQLHELLTATELKLDDRELTTLDVVSE